jgi:hypothetical protein
VFWSWALSTLNINMVDLAQNGTAPKGFFKNSEHPLWASAAINGGDHGRNIMEVVAK